MAKILSLVVPFHNSEEKCLGLLSMLRKIQDKDIEIILVDDGSTDSTFALLEKFSTECGALVKIVRQSNKGPGGARNTGIAECDGEYVWLIDSDDDVLFHKAFELVRQVRSCKYDVIDFNLVSDSMSINSMELSEGVYTYSASSKCDLISNFGRICTKIIKRSIFSQKELKYPEYCFYEDNPMRFILLFFIRTVYKSEVAVYLHRKDGESITRGPQSGKYFDRMIMACWGYRQGRHLAGKERDLASVIHSIFVRQYVVNTGSVRYSPIKGLILKARVCKKFRADCRVERANASLRVVLRAARSRDRGYLYMVFLVFAWALSLLIPSQDKYFRKQRLRG